jgi:hypothetical protein
VARALEKAGVVFIDPDNEMGPRAVARRPEAVAVYDDALGAYGGPPRRDMRYSADRFFRIKT